MMGLFDLLACFSCRTSPTPSESENDRLVAPGRLRAQSVLSQDGYGTMSMSSTLATSQNGGRVTSNPASPPRISNQQRARMAEISRAAGSHMRPIGTYVLGNGRNAWNTEMLRSVSQTSSRGSSPSPPRPQTSPADGVMGGSTGKPRTSSDASQDSQFSDMTDSTHSDLTRSTSSSRCSPEPVVGPDGVIRKSIFGDSIQQRLQPNRPRVASGSRRPSGRSKKRTR